LICGRQKGLRFKVFALVINLLGADWSPKHIAIVFFEAFDTFRHALAKDLIELLGKYVLRKKIHY